MVFTIVLILMIVINAYFSAAEIALVSVRKFRIQKEADSGNKKASLVLNILNNPDEYLSSIQVGITLVAIIEGLYGGAVLETYLEPKFLSLGLSAWLAHIISLVLGIGSITYLTIVLGELLPKSIALQFPQKMVFLIAPSFKFFTFITFPFVKLLTTSTHFLLRLWPRKGSESKKISDADLKSLLAMAYNQGTLEKKELILHENIFDFYDRTIGKIMTPLEKIICIDEKAAPELIEDILRKSTHNYFPVIRNKTEVLGTLCAKDFFMNRIKTLKEIVAPPCIVKETEHAPELLEKFNAHNINFGIVVNNDGCITGLVTMHDIGSVLIGKFP